MNNHMEFQRFIQYLNSIKKNIKDIDCNLIKNIKTSEYYVINNVIKNNLKKLIIEIKNYLFIVYQLINIKYSKLLKEKFDLIGLIEDIDKRQEQRQILINYNNEKIIKRSVYMEYSKKISNIFDELLDMYLFLENQQSFTIDEVKCFNDFNSYIKLLDKQQNFIIDKSKYFNNFNSYINFKYNNQSSNDDITKDFYIFFKIMYILEFYNKSTVCINKIKILIEEKEKQYKIYKEEIKLLITKEEIDNIIEKADLNKEEIIKI